MRFQAEAQAAAQLKHDNIVTVYDAGNVDGHLYIALEYVEGTDVYDLVSKRGSLPVSTTSRSNSSSGMPFGSCQSK